MKTQQTDNPRIKTIHDESGDYAVIDNSMIVQLDSTTRPPEQETEKMIAETLRQQPIERTVTILADDYDGLKTICKHYREKCAQITAQRDELLAALKNLVADWERVQGREIESEHEAKAAIAKCEANK